MAIDFFWRIPTHGEPSSHRARTPIPPANPSMAWVDLETQTGKLVMASAPDNSGVAKGMMPSHQR